MLCCAGFVVAIDPEHHPQKAQRYPVVSSNQAHCCQLRHLPRCAGVIGRQERLFVGESRDLV
jgi:hypothetical protein